MGKADLHAHTCNDSWGDGNQSVEELLRYVEEETDLDLFGITDHDNTDTARTAWRLYCAGGYRFGFLPGVEITNQAGHLLCYFPSGEVFDIPSLRPFWWTVRYARDRGAVCIVAHPIYPPWAGHVLRHGLDRGRHVDAIEVVNAGIGERGRRRLAELGDRLADRVARVGNSDAHDRSAVGAAFTEFPGSSADDYLRALAERTTEPVFARRPAMDRAARRFTIRRSMTRPGWVRNIWREVRGSGEVRTAR
jgi:predicted metal-dependent phosphoesterase TrpH